MENDFSAIKSIQELKNLLDSGAITQEEYEVLKRKIIFGNTTADNTAAPLVPPVAPAGDARILVPPPAIREPEPNPPRINTPTVNTPTEPNHQRFPEAQPVTPPVRPAKVPINLIDEYSKLSQAEEQPPEKGRDWLLTILISLAAILLIGLVAYWLLSSDSPSERLTSTSGPDTEEVITDNTRETNTPEARPEPVITESTNPAKIPTDPAPENVPAPTNPPETAVVPAPEGNRSTETTEPAPAATPIAQPAPRLTNEEAINKIKDRLQAYYSDFKAAPFAAQNHFAPNVERYYTLTGTTPQAINENINTYHYPEFQDSESNIEEGTLKLVNTGENGFEVTYIEHGKAFRKSKGQKQETTARVRARFDKDFKITFFRQEQLLENKFIDE
jgi:hypothetical protein